MGRTEGQLTALEILQVQELNSAANNTVIYKNNSGIVSSISLGAIGTGLISQGATSPPIFSPVGLGDMILSSAQTNSGLKTFLNGTFGFRNIANTFTSLFANANTASRTYTFQDRDGTIADNTDLALKAPLASPTFTGVSKFAGISLPIVTKTANYPVTTSDYTILGDSTAGNITITLPTAVGNNQIFVVKKIVVLNSVIIATTSAQTIDGSATITLNAQFSSIGIQSDGANWNIIF